MNAENKYNELKEYILDQYKFFKEHNPETDYFLGEKGAWTHAFDKINEIEKKEQEYRKKVEEIMKEIGEFKWTSK